VALRGYAPLQKSIFLDYQPLLDAAFRLRNEDLADGKTFERMIELLTEVRLEFALTRSAP